ncbi:MAG TPA: alpha/beta hydrolase [Conexibacter sp.]|jgi:pimeloyl-ACP methyl ester carboxylesterase|nr:alpha/beta hydrolase [Conexibacter sp.]
MSTPRGAAPDASLGASPSAIRASASEQPHRFRSPLLGERIALDLPQGTLEAFRRGDGPPLVLAHGWLANANLWRGVVDRLADRFTCVALDLPLGAHREPLDADADLTPTGCGALIAAALDALALGDDVTLIGNDSGGAYSQIAVAAQPERVTQLVLTSCETPYDPFPPPPFDGLPALAGDPAQLRALLSALEDRAIRAAPAAFGLLAKHGLPDEISDSYALPCLRDNGVLRDTAKAMASADPAPVHAAGRALIERVAMPMLLAWSREDPVFPFAHAERYAAALPDARLVAINDSYSFTPEDQPAALAAAIATFALSASV